MLVSIRRLQVDSNSNYNYSIRLLLKRSYNKLKRPLKTDSAPIRGDGYKSSLTQSQYRDIAQRADRT
jgi:hypothetical protein